MKTLFLAFLAFTALSLFGSAQGRAATISSTLPEFTGAFYDPSDTRVTYPLSLVTIGVFSYSLPAGASIFSATVTGSFGNSSVNSTALSDYYLGSVPVASCSSLSDPCFNGPLNPFDPPVIWSYTLAPAQYPTLLTGSVPFRVVQNGPFTVQTGTARLTIQTTDPVPEPGTFAALAGGLAASALFRRGRRALGVLGGAAVAVAFLCHPASAQVTWTATSAPVQANLAGGPWTLSQGGPVTPVTPTDYCVSGVPLLNPATTVTTMQPFYFPFVIGRGLNLQGYFDYRPRNINEATVAANSTDGGLTWTFQQQVEQLTAGCPADNVNSNGNDSGQGHPSILSFGGATWLYLLDRRGGHLDSDGLLVHRLTPRAGLPLSPLPLNAFTLPPASATITRWDFNNLATSVNNSPAPSIGVGTATPLGMTNNYAYVNPTVTGSVASCDILATTGSSDTGQNSWRIRGASPGNGWNTAAPQYTQGVEFDASTAGYSNIIFQYDWYSTNQGVRDLQAQYTVDGTTWTNAGPLQIASPSSYNNQITINFPALGITAVNNNPRFGVRLVSAYDPTYPGASTYTGATLTADGSPVVYNNSSGNWRFDEVNVLGSANGSSPALPDAPVNTTGLLNPDGMVTSVSGTFPRKVLYVAKTLSGDLGFPASQVCGLTPSGKAANHDVEQIRLAQTTDGIHFTDLGPVNGLSDPTTVSYSVVRYVAPNGSLLRLPNGRYGLFYGGGNCLDGDSDGFHAILYAESADLINWTVINGINNPIASVSSVTAVDPVTQTSVTIPSTAPVLGATQPWFAGRVYNPNAIISADGLSLNLIFAGYNAGYSADLSSYRTIGRATLSANGVPLQ